MSDGWGGIDNAMIAVYGQVPEYTGRGRPPTHKQPQPGWQYLPMVKHRDEHGHLVNTELRVIFGQPEEVLTLFGKSTAYIERTHLTMRLFNGRSGAAHVGLLQRMWTCTEPLPRGRTPSTIWSVH